MTQTPKPLVATGSQTVGPFFSFGLTTNPRLGTVAAPEAAGEHIRLTIRVIDGAGVPVPDSVIELYQADASGTFDMTPQFRGFGRLGTDVSGSCTFETIRPGVTPDDAGRPQASHINLCVFMRGMLRHVYTRVYFAGDPGLDTDPVLVLVPAERRATLLAQPIADAPAAWMFEIHLQGDRETVFFDL
jgi:protocatechuate 3,4-dioxygenase alpha subunit